MVQWIEHIAGWLKPIYEAMWQETKAGNYLQIDETPVKVLDRDVSGKTARGYLWFYAVPREDVIWSFAAVAARTPPTKDSRDSRAPSRPMPMKCTKRWLRESEDRANRCLAHARRYFYKALQESLGEAVWFIGKIRSCTASNMQPVRWITPNAMLCGRCKRLSLGCLASPRRGTTTEAVAAEHHGQGPSTIF